MIDNNLIYPSEEVQTKKNKISLVILVAILIVVAGVAISTVLYLRRGGTNVIVSPPRVELTQTEKMAILNKLLGSSVSASLKKQTLNELNKNTNPAPPLEEKLKILETLKVNN